MIFTRHSVLKRGCSIWDKEAMPEEEFRARLDALRHQMARQGLDALVIYGDNWSYADLCYLTNYFPKVRGGIGVIPRSGPLALLLNIGSRDVPFAKSLTWVEDVRASGQVGRDGAELLKEKGLAQAKIGLVDSGKGLPLPQLEELSSVLPQVDWKPSHSLIQQMRPQKSARELAALREAGRVLKEIWDEAKAIIQPGKKEHEAIADLDKVARNKGVEDIRILAGEKRLQPPSSKITAGLGSHWAVYLAIQHRRYWVEAGRTFNLTGDVKIEASYRKARESVARMAAGLKPENSIDSVDEVARAQLEEFYATASAYGLGNGIGLNPWEAPFLSEDEALQQGAPAGSSRNLQDRMALALRVAFETEGKLILFGDSYQVTSDGPLSLINRR